MTRIIVTMIPEMTDPVPFAKALADATRWRILRLVTDRALCVCELADILEMPQSSVSSHVQVIRRAELLESETCAKWTYFRVKAPHRALLADIAARFPGPDPAVFARDAERRAARLAARASSCCPGPKSLAS